MKIDPNAVVHTDDRRFAEELAREIAPRHNRVPVALFADNRDPITVAARRELVVRLRWLGWSTPRIGRAIGRHHTAVLNLLRDPTKPRRRRPLFGARLPVARAAA